LIEVLVAVGVASILMAVLIRSFVSTWAGINIVREEAEGTMLARSLLDEALLRGALAPGTQEGTMGRYAWNVTTTLQTVATVAAVQPRAGGDANQPQQATTANIFHIAVTMRGPSGRSSRLDAYKFGAAPAQ
jgi:type II secretory pathway pseudopilin PulG